MRSTRCIGPLHYEEQWAPRATGPRLEALFNILLAHGYGSSLLQVQEVGPGRDVRSGRINSIPTFFEVCPLLLGIGAKRQEHVVPGFDFVRWARRGGGLKPLDDFRIRSSLDRVRELLRREACKLQQALIHWTRVDVFTVSVRDHRSAFIEHTTEMYVPEHGVTHAPRRLTSKIHAIASCGCQT